MLFSVALSSTSQVHLLIANCLLPVGTINVVMFIWILIYHCLFTLVLKSPKWGVVNEVHITYIPLIDPPSILHWHSINTSVYTQSTLHQHLSVQLVNNQLILIDELELVDNSTDCSLSVNHASIEYWLKCQSRVSIERIDRHLTKDAFSAHDPDIVWSFKLSLWHF